MGRDELIRRAKALLSAAYEEAAELVLLYLDAHPGEHLKPLCQEIDPDNWNALRHRVQRARDAREAAPQAEPECPPALSSTERTAKSVLNDPEKRERVIDELPDATRQEIARDLAEREHTRLDLPPERRQGYFDVHHAVSRARRDLRETLARLQRATLDGQARELLAEDVNELREALDVIALAIDGTAPVDWDAELAKLDAESSV